MNLIQKLIVLAFFLFATIACGGGESDTEEEKEEATEEEDTSSEEEEKEEEADMSSDEAKMLAKTWKMTEFIHEKGETEQAQEEDLLTLNVDGTYIDTIEGKEMESGTWQLSEDKKEVVFKVEKGEFMGSTKRVSIKELTKEKLVTVDDDGKMTETFVPAEASSEEEGETEEGAE